MSSIKFIVSDLHLAGGHPVLDGFGESQQSAFEGLTAAASASGPLGADDVELIINGDCFDFLATAPYDTGGSIDAATALSKLQQITTAHRPFFEALQRFIQAPGRHITFTTGNHDIELQFEEIRAALRMTIGVAQDDSRVYFCPSRIYRPLTNVYIEHGNHYDFWNQSLPGLWDDAGHPLDVHPTTITYPIGSLYFQHAAHPISIAYPYFDHFEPSINTTRQIALLCLLNPAIVLETATHTLELLSEPRKSLANLSPGDEQIPGKLFEHAMTDFAAFQQDITSRKPDWVEPGGQDRAERIKANTMMEYLMLRETLTLPTLEAVAAICTPTTYQMGESVAFGMHNVLKNEPDLRYAIAGHTHMVRIDPVNNGMQSYLNTASWTTRIALPAPGEVTPELVEWLRHPDMRTCPLRDVTELIFAMLHTTSEGSSSASLCVWEGGAKGQYRVLA